MQLPEVVQNAGPGLTELLLRAIMDVIATALVVFGIYYPAGRQREYVFTFSLFNVVIFITCLLLGTARINLGFAFGLFAVFSIMRYRTVMIPVKEMGYLFVSMSLGIMNALVNNDGYFLTLLAANIFILIIVFALERYAGTEQYKEIVYERIDLIKPENKAELAADLHNRTGLTIHRTEIVSIDLLHDTAIVRAYFKP